MTKFYEEFTRKDVDHLEKFEREPKGELTVVISDKLDKKSYIHDLSETDKNMIKKMINKFSIKEISNLFYKDKKISKREIYNYCLKLKHEK